MAQEEELEKIRTKLYGAIALVVIAAFVIGVVVGHFLW